MSATFDWNNIEGVQVVVPLLIVGAKLLINFLEKRKAEKEVTEAEEKVFKVPEPLLEKILAISQTQESLNNQAKNIEKALDESRDFLQKGTLSNLYNKQIEKYQTETRARAGWSFLIAILAMCFGLAFVFWGGLHLLSTDSWRGVAAGTAISSIGGAVSAYIARTFLNIHKISLVQLNHYFRQPVLNSHILTAQSIADQMSDNGSKQKGYESILSRVLLLIRYDEGAESPNIMNSEIACSPHEVVEKPKTTRNRRGKPANTTGQKEETGKGPSTGE